MTVNREEKRTGLFARLYCDYLSDPEVLGLLDSSGGLAAWGVHTLVQMQSRLHLTDGVVSPAVLRAYRGTRRHAAALVACGLWAERDDGWLILNYAKDNDMKTDVSARVRLGEIARCKGWMKKGKECSCGEHEQPDAA